MSVNYPPDSLSSESQDVALSAHRLNFGGKHIPILIAGQKIPLVNDSLLGEVVGDDAQEKSSWQSLNEEGPNSEGSNEDASTNVSKEKSPCHDDDENELANLAAYEASSDSESESDIKCEVDEDEVATYSGSSESEQCDSDTSEGEGSEVDMVNDDSSKSEVDDIR